MEPAKKLIFPELLKVILSKNGRVKEEHAPRSIIYRACKGCPEFEEREFQLASVDLFRGARFFRCAHCGSIIKE